MDRDRFLVVAPTSTVRAFLPYVLLAAGLFLAATVLGAAAGVGGQADPPFPIAGAEPSLDAYSFWDFFGHNATIGLILAGGALLAGIPTVYLLLFNGFAIGSVLAEAVETLGFVPTVVGILPHAVFELPALWIGAAVCFRTLHVVWKVAKGDPQYASLHVIAAQTTLALCVILVLFAIAAVVETRVTPVLLDAAA